MCRGVPEPQLSEFTSVLKGHIFLLLSGNHKYRPFCDALHVSEMWWPRHHHYVSLCGMQRGRTSQAEEESGDPRACRWVLSSSMNRGLRAEALFSCDLAVVKAVVKALELLTRGGTTITVHFLLCTS